MQKIVTKPGTSLPDMPMRNHSTRTWMRVWPPIRVDRFFRAASIAMVFTIFACAGCTDNNAESALEINPSVAWRGEMLEIDTGVQFEPTPRMRDALESGVDLQLQVITRVSRNLGPVALKEIERAYPITIRFLPMTEQWQMEIDNRQFNFPRIWLLLEALTQARGYATGLTRERASDGAWQVQVRVRFNREALPSPMHLPSLISPQWRLAGKWHTWQLGDS